MTNSYYNGTTINRHTLAQAETLTSAFTSVAAGFELLPEPALLDENRVTYAVDTGSADTYAITLPQTATAYTEGMMVRVKFTNTNTGASTLNVDSLGARSIKLVNGTDPAAGDLTIGDIYDLVYKGTTFVLLAAPRSYLNNVVTTSANVTITGGAIDGTPIGGTTPAAGSFTTLTTTSTGGIGISSPDGTLHVHTASAGAVAANVSADDLVVENSTTCGISLLSPATSAGYIMFGIPTSSHQASISYAHPSDIMSFRTNATNTVELGSVIGFRPQAALDNTIPLGGASTRWSEVFAGTGTINTSDERTKTDIQDLDAAEQVVAATAKALLKKYRFKEAKDAKGDKARWHFGIVAQELAAAFEAEGLDPWAYGLLCHDFWVEADVTIPAGFKQVVATPAEFDEEGNEITPAVYEEVEETPERIEHQTFATLADVPEGAANVVEHDRMGVRYEELFALILRAV